VFFIALIKNFFKPFASVKGIFAAPFALGGDTQTLTSPPAKLGAVMDVLTVDAMGLPSAAKIEEMQVQYGNAAITATLDKDGRITRMEHRLYVTDATANGSYVMSVTARMHGDAVTQYTVTY